MENHDLETISLKAEKEREEEQRFRIKLKSHLCQRFQKVQESLKERGVNDFTLSDYLNFVIEKADHDNQIIESFTPLEFRVKKALLDENLRKRIEKIISG